MKAFSNCPCAGDNLNRLIQPAIMTVLAEGPLHGYQVIREIARLAISRGREPDPTGVYRTLKFMEEAGLVASEWELDEPGPPKRRYSLTRTGRECLKQWVRTLEEYHEAVAELAAAARSAARSTSRKSKSGRR